MGIPHVCANTFRICLRNQWNQNTTVFSLMDRWELWSSGALWGLLWPVQGAPGGLDQGRCEERQHQLLHGCLYPLVPDLYCHWERAGKGWRAGEDAGIPHQGLWHGQTRSVTSGAGCRQGIVLVFFLKTFDMAKQSQSLLVLVVGKVLHWCSSSRALTKHQSVGLVGVIHQGL